MVPLLVSTNLRDFYSHEDHAALHDVTSAITYAREVNVTSTTPETASVDGGQTFQLRLDQPIEAIPQLACFVADMTFEDLLISADRRTVFCKTFQFRPGFASIGLTLNARSLSLSGSQIIFAMNPVVLSVEPMSAVAEGGTVMHVEGSGLTANGPLCRFNKVHPIPATFVSSKLVKCESLPLQEGVSLVEAGSDNLVSIGTQQLASHAVLEAEGLSMLDGSEQGGDVLTVHAEILEGEGVFCRFGPLGPIAANPVAADHAQCVSPAHMPAKIPVELSWLPR